MGINATPASTPKRVQPRPPLALLASLVAASLCWTSAATSNLPTCANAVSVACATADGNGVRLSDGTLMPLADGAAAAGFSPDGRHVHYLMSPNELGTPLVVNDVRHMLASDLGLGAFDRSSRYLAYTENQAGLWLLDIRRSKATRGALCGVNDDPAERRHLDRLVGVFDPVGSVRQVLWHRRTENVECYRLEEARAEANAALASPQVAPLSVPRPSPSGKVLSREHVTSSNPTNGVVGFLHTAGALRRGFQIFAEPAPLDAQGSPLKVVVDGDDATVVNALGHIVCSWNGPDGIPCEDLLLATPEADPALAYIESRTIGGATWHLVRFGRYAGWIRDRAGSAPQLLGERIAMGPR